MATASATATADVADVAAANATVKTVQFVDPRIEPQPDPVYDYIIGPTQNQYYRIPASGKSNDNITFNNLTTLGIDRAYLDTFEIEIEAEIHFHIAKITSTVVQEQTVYSITPDTGNTDIIPAPDEWTFQSFPFNTCCSEAHVNINGGAFMTQPMCYIRAKERYMNQYELSKCYENICPIHRPVCQTESGRVYAPGTTLTQQEGELLNLPLKFDTSTIKYMEPQTQGDPVTKTVDAVCSGMSCGYGFPTRYGRGMYGYMQSEEGMCGGFNNSIVSLGKWDTTAKHYENMYRDTSTGDLVVKVTWREPIMCSPFSSRYDATFGRPLYNITSMDFSFTMMDLGNMIRVCNVHAPNDRFVNGYDVNITAANLCYQVMTIPAVLKKPTTTLVPYRRFVPYITEYNSNNLSQGGTATSLANGGECKISSGVYTFNQVPTAIWVFLAPIKTLYQTNPPDSSLLDPKTLSTFTAATNILERGNYESNNLFGYLKAINISLANTTQILATAKQLDLYRIAKANGCQDSYLSWGCKDTLLPKNIFTLDGTAMKHKLMYYGAGSVLRLVPGTDIILPDTPLIPGANANNMVIQVHAEFDVPPHSNSRDKYALWLLFEEVGVAAISPGQCEISMNPVGSGEIMGVSPVMSSTNNFTEGALNGFGWRDHLKTAASIASQVADSGIISKILRKLNKPWANKVADWTEAHGMGEMGDGPARKRTRGGAVIGHGMNDWI